MPAPKSVKITYKGGKTDVTYESNLDATQYYLFELTRAALRDVGKFVCKKFQELYYQHFEKHRNRGGKGAKYSVWASKNTKFPRVQVGHSNMRGFYGFFQEFGTHDGSVPRLGLLTKSVQDNVDKIVEIESQYLSGLSEEAARLAGQVNEKEYGGDADGDD